MYIYIYIHIYIHLSIYLSAGGEGSLLGISRGALQQHTLVVEREYLRGGRGHDRVKG